MINGELLVDNFAGGGGASTGIELATGYSVDIAINHDPEAIRMHKANHPSTKHYCEDVWQVDPIEACGGRPVALAWFSPDCKHFSKAKGGKPKDKFIRGLAWVACRWAGLVRPRVIMLENVEEFKTWGPLNRGHRPMKRKRGNTFNKFINQLSELGYVVEFKELIAADYGVPTKRKRFFMIARCDGRPIIWPEPTHGDRNSEAVKQGLMEPYIGAYTQLDFDLPCPSIFDSSDEIKDKYGLRAVRPLAPKTMERIAKGLQKFVIETDEPFIISNHNGRVEPYLVQIGQTGFTEDRSKDVREPLTTIVSKNEHCLIETKMTAFLGTNTTKHPGGSIEEPIHTITTGNQQMLLTPTLIQYHSYDNTARGQSIKEPILTVDGSNRYGLVSAFIQQYYNGGYKGFGKGLEEPLPTVTAIDHNSICRVVLEKNKEIDGGKVKTENPQYADWKEEKIQTSHIIQMNNHCDGKDISEPIPTITAGDGHFGEVRAFLIKYYGQGNGQNVKEPLDTITANDRFGLVTIKGIDYQIVDIGLRMLEPKELYGCNGVPRDYIIDHDCEGNAITRTEQVKKCGNMVCPPIPAALVKSNLSELCKCTRMPNLHINDKEEQLSFAV